MAMPVTRTVSAGEPDALVRALAAGAYAAIVVASPRAAQALVAAVEAGGHRERCAEIWCVGPATREVIDRAGLASRQPEDARDGAELAAAMAGARDLRGERVLVPRAEQGRAELVDGLRAAGASVVEVVCYRTEPATMEDPAVRAGAALLADGTARVCAVFAPSQVSALVTIVGQLGSLRVAWCAIGETTAAALRDAGVMDVSVAPAPTPEGMAHAVRSVYPTRQ